MKTMNYLVIFFVSFIVIGCSKVVDPIKKIGLGSRIVSYEADDSTNSLVIPPDLTKPSSVSLFSESIEVTGSQDILAPIANVEVMRDSYQRWLLVDKTSDEVWALSKDFFRSYGFRIEKENQKIGILETDYLEIETKVPDKSLGAIRTALSKALKTQYGLPIADKYRVRIEPTDDANISEIYLTLSSIGEVMSGSQRVWQPREKDIELETEMLLKLMVYLGNDSADAITKMQSSISEEKTIASVVTAESGFATLVFPYDKKQSWSFLGWALDELSIDIDDRDSVEGSYFIKVTPSKGLFSKLLSAAGSTKTYQLIVKEFDDSQTYVIFNDLSEENDSDTKNYSNELFNNIASKF